MRRIAIVAVMALATLVSLITSPTRAEDKWDTLPCKSGELITKESIVSDERSIIPGTIGCTSNDAEKKYAIAYFYAQHPGGYIIDERLMLSYPTTVGTTPQSDRFYLLEEPPQSPDMPEPNALCLVAEPRTRLSCVQLSFVNNVRAVEPISVDDPIVQKEVEVGSGPLIGSTPVCATCRQLLPGDPPPKT